MHNKEELLKTFYTSLFEIEQKRDEIKADIQNLEEQVEIIKKSDNEAREVISINEKLIGLSSKADKAIEQAKKTLEDNKNLLDKKKNKIEELRVELDKLNEKIKKMVDVLYELMGKEEIAKYLQDFNESKAIVIKRILSDNLNTDEKLFDKIYPDVENTSAYAEKPNIVTDTLKDDVINLLQMSKEDKNKLFSNLKIEKRENNNNDKYTFFDIKLNNMNGELGIYYKALQKLLRRIRNYGDVMILCNGRRDSDIQVAFPKGYSISLLPEEQQREECLKILDKALQDIYKDIDDFLSIPEFQVELEEERKKSFYKLFGININILEQEKHKTSIDDVIKYAVDEMTILKQRKESLLLDKKESDFKTSAEDLKIISIYEPLISKCQKLAIKQDFIEKFRIASAKYEYEIKNLIHKLKDNKNFYLNDNILENCSIIIAAFNDVLVNITNKDYNMRTIDNLVNQMNKATSLMEKRDNIKKIPLFGSKAANKTSISILEKTYKTWNSVYNTMEKEKAELSQDSDELLKKVRLETGIDKDFYGFNVINYGELEEALYQRSGIEPREKMGQRKQIIDNIIKLYYELDGQKIHYDVYEKENLERFLDDVNRLISQRKQEYKDELTRIDERLPKLESLLYDLNQFGYFVKDISAEELKKAENGIKR